MPHSSSPPSISTMFVFSLFKRKRCVRSTLFILMAIPFLLVIISLVELRSRKAHIAHMTSEQEVFGLWANISGEVKQRCVHPHLQLWHPDLKQHFKRLEQFKCTPADKNWVYTSNGTFYISEEMSIKHNNRIDCKMTPVLRGSDDFGVRRGQDVKPFPNGSILQSDIFEAKCVAGDGNVNSMVLLGVEPKEEVKERAKLVKSLPESALGLDIIMFGFDSVSRMTWQRNLPKTYDYFTKELGGTVLEGYNIVGDGTPQALLPILTGQTEIELPEARRGFAGAKVVDGHPWIWKDLKKLGYATQWGEDSASFGTFTYRMLGFKDQPVDHYMRPFYIEAEKHYSKYQQYCLGSLLRSKNMMNYQRDFCDVYKSQRKFSFIFHAEYSHGGYSELQYADEDLVEHLQYLRSRGHLDNAILILMADHGARFHELRSSEQGKYEERMPFFSVRLPEKFLAEHPDIAKNLKINAKRLTTPFDIHATLRDVLDFGGDKAKLGEDPSDPLPRGISLFREIPKRRSCGDAAIEPHWCGCLSWEVVDIGDSVVKSAAQVVVNKMNQITAEERGNCQTLKVGKILNAVRFATNEKVLKFKGSSDMHGRTPNFSDKMTRTEYLYQVTLTTEPGGGKFEATVRNIITTGNISVDSSAISRINRYGKHPHCVAEKFPHMRSYCYCKVQLETDTHADEEIKVVQESTRNVADKKQEVELDAEIDADIILKKDIEVKSIK